MSSRSEKSTSIFRSTAWGEAWLDTWGKDKRLQLIDLGGRQNPREMLYRVAARIKKTLPIHSLHLVGVSSPLISTPRAEYNAINELVESTGSANALITELKKLSWSQFHLPDLNLTTDAKEILQQLAGEKIWAVHELRAEAAYYVSANDFSVYLSGLGANTRLTYFNRRERLSQLGEIEFVRYPIEKAFTFFDVLNQFHRLRWAMPCYSARSQEFLKNFMSRLSVEQGIPILEAMLVNGEIVSVLFDVEFNGCRYNFQSGYLENKFPKIALGALHMGYGIQAAIAAGHIYDFMAGEGKNSNYKERIATHQEMMKSITLERGLLKYLRQLKRDRH